MILHIARFGSAIGTCHNHLFRHRWTFFLTRVCKMCFPSICFLPWAPLWGVAFCTYAGSADKEMDFEWQLWTKTHTIIDRSWTALNIVACPIFRLEWTSSAVFRLHTWFLWTVSHMLRFYITSKRKLGIAHEHFVTVIQFSYRRVTICKLGQPVWYSGDQMIDSNEMIDIF